MPDAGRLSLTLADVLAHIEADSTLSPTRRRDLKSAIRRFCTLVDREPAQVPARMCELRPVILALNPAQAGLSRKSLQNVKADLASAMRYAGADRLSRRSLSEDWRALHDHLLSKRLKNGLSRFARFCSTHGIPPNAVVDDVVAQFVAWLSESTFARNPKEIHRRTCRLWNEAAATVDGWPQIRLTMPDHRPPRRRLPLEAFPKSFQRELERYLAMRADPDPFDTSTPAKPLKPGTLRLRREQLRVAASALVERGHAASQIQSLADLVHPQAFKDVLRQLLADHGGEANAWAEGMGKTLIAVAKEWVRVDAGHLAELKRLMARLPQVRPGLTRKNRTMLRQFDDEANLGRLLGLPDALFRAANRIEPPTHKAAVKAQIALAIELLLNCPIRGHNLIALHLHTHVLWPGGPKGPVYICLEPDEVKNEVRIDFELPQHLVEMLDTYLRRYHPLIGGSDCAFLFTTRGGRRKDQRTLAQQIQATISKETGLRMTVHQFRHLGAKLHLQENPGAFESLRQLLAHKSTKVTVNSYAGLDTRTAARLHDELIARRREELAAKPGRARRKPASARKK